MEAIDPHKAYNYSHDQLTKTMFELELGHLRMEEKWSMESEVVKAYLRERIKEIQERWRV